MKYNFDQMVELLIIGGLVALIALIAFFFSDYELTVEEEKD